MKQLRNVLAVLLCLLAVLQGSAALAAAKDAPTVSITAPKSGVESGTDCVLVIKSSLPGFLTLRLLDATGREYMTLYTFKEIHSKENNITFTAKDENGEFLGVGDYLLDAVVVTQFGVSSANVTAKLTVTESQLEWVETTEAPASTSSSSSKTASSSKTSGSSSASSSSKENSSSTSSSSSKENSSSTSSSSSKTSSSTSKEVTYTSGSGIVGEEGYDIGVGVSDVIDQRDICFWTLDAKSSDEDLWKAIIAPIVTVDVGENESAYIYNSVKDNRKRLGTISGLSHGVNVIENRADGWSLVETFRNEDGAFVRGYIRTKTLRVVEPNQTYGLIVDKATQTLTVFKDGKRIGSCAVTTGLPTVKYLQRETPAGEYITVTRRGVLEYSNTGYTKYTIRINGSYYLCEIPSTKKNGTNFSLLEDALGEKGSRGSVCIQHEPSNDGGINAEWIWDMTDANKKVKVLIFDDKDRGDVPVGSK